MNVYRPLRAVVFVYEVCRLLVLLGVFAAFSPVDETMFPSLLYVVPNALFPLMTCFLWLDLERYTAYLPLYMAGKVIGVVAIAGWYIVSFPYIIETVQQTGSGIVVVALFVLAVADTLSILGGCMIQNKIKLATQAPGDKVVALSEQEEM
jgi:hypothetical protein